MGNNSRASTDHVADTITVPNNDVVNVVNARGSLLITLAKTLILNAFPLQNVQGALINYNYILTCYVQPSITYLYFPP